MKEIIALFWVMLLIFLVSLSGCGQTEQEKEQSQQIMETQQIAQGEQTEEQTEEEICINLCKEFQGEKSNGPCLGLIKDDWVCDVAHSPRQDMDNNPENQCIEYREGMASHFIEVDEDCNLIRKF